MERRNLAARPRQNLAARAGRWSARHRKTAIWGWIAFVIAAVMIGGAVGTNLISDEDSQVGEAGRAERVLADRFEKPAPEQVLVQSSTLRVSDPRFRAAVDDVIARLSRTRDVESVHSPLWPENAGQISRDRRSALVEFEIPGDPDTAKDRVAPSLDATAALQRSHPQMRIEQFGAASAEKAFDQSFEDDLAKAGTLSVPITLAILIVAFGALVAAGIPVLLAITAVAATMGLIAIPSQIAAVEQSVSEVILLIGLAVGVDYSLFYMRREREERAAGRSEQASLEAAAATSGRSVLISGLTVMAAMAGLYFTGDKTFGSFATGTMMVVAIAMIGSLTVLPALLSWLGDRVMKGRVPLLAARRERGRESRLWGAILDRVLRRPLVSAILAAAVLLALAAPVLGMHTASTGIQGLPESLPATQALRHIEAAFPGGPAPADVVVQARDVSSPATARAIAELERRALATGKMLEPISTDVNSRRDVAVVSIPLVGDGTDSRSYAALTQLRDEVIPATVGRVPGARADVTGLTAQSKDFNDQMKASAPLVFAFVLTMAFILLLVTFRSVVIPLKAIVLNLLSVGAAYGVLVLVFQHGWGEWLLGFESSGAVTSWLPMFLFVILFGLSMDYHVFILSRVREAYDRGMTTEQAVAHGIKSTAGVVTSAAIVMVAVFGVFGTLGALDFKQMGVGLATAVLIDATIVRAVLLPAAMKLLGDHNWYLPKRLEWLPEIEHEPLPAPTASAPQPTT